MRPRPAATTASRSDEAQAAETKVTAMSTPAGTNESDAESLARAALIDGQFASARGEHAQARERYAAAAATTDRSQIFWLQWSALRYLTEASMNSRDWTSARVRGTHGRVEHGSASSPTPSGNQQTLRFPQWILRSPRACDSVCRRMTWPLPASGHDSADRRSLSNQHVPHARCGVAEVLVADHRLIAVAVKNTSGALGI